jgi:hypothetical protein
MALQDEAEEAAIHDGNTWAAARRRTTLLANLAVVMERTDECALALTMLSPAHRINVMQTHL